ncbi:MAG: MlaD family protein [Chthoniobacterales bacterium]
MSDSPKYFRLGVFVMIGIGILVGGLLIFGAGSMFKPKIMFETYVNGTVQGLDVGSPLKFRGVTVGKVTQIGFIFDDYPEETMGKIKTPKARPAGSESHPEAASDPAQDPKPGVTHIRNYVVIVMEVDKEIFPEMFNMDLTPLLKRSITQGLRMQIEPQGITGMNFMNIGYLKKEQMTEKMFQPVEINWTPRYYYIPSAPGQLTSMLDAANDMMRRMQDMMGELKQADLGKMGQEIHTMIANVNKALVDINPEQLGGDAHALLTSMQTSSQHLQVILKNIEPASKLNADQINAIVTNVRTITDNLRTLSENVKQNPSSLIFSRPPAKAKVFEAPKKR